MTIFKFGGASVKDADGVKNLLNVVNKKADKNTIIVVSAMGKTTNALEKIVSNYFTNKNDLNLLISANFPKRRVNPLGTTFLYSNQKSNKSPRKKIA